MAWHPRFARRRSKQTRPAGKPDENSPASRGRRQARMRITGRARRIEPFYVMEVAKAASQLAREVAHTDRPMIFLNIGEPDFTAPPLVQEAAAKAIRDGLTQYTQATGLDTLRERISDWYFSRF